MNPFIESNKTAMEGLLTRCARVPVSVTGHSVLVLSQEEKSISVERLHYYIGLHIDRIYVALQDSAERQEIAASLRAALSRLGAPPEHNPKRKLEMAALTAGTKGF
jgi:hypothetical protein